MDKNSITYQSCGIENIEEFYKEKFAHNVSYDIQNKKNYEYNILNLKQTYIYDYIQKDSKVLDFGCGSGTYKILKNLGCYLVGVDLSEKAIQNAKDLNAYDEAYALDIFDSFFDKYLNYFDHIISSDVFGHIEFKDKDKVIQRLNSLLKENGTMIHGIETGDIKYNDMTPQERYDFVSVDGHVGMESEEQTTKRFQKYFKTVQTYTPYGIINDLDEIIKQNKSYAVSYLDDKLISYLEQKTKDQEFKDAFNTSQYCTHKAYEANTKPNNFLNLYGFSFLVASNQEIKKFNHKKPDSKPKQNQKVKTPSLKIAIIAPSPVPFGIGGAEKLWWGMQEYINKHTTNQCELIKIPTKENNFWNLIESYNTFYKLDLSHFDMVISTKYPAWMIQHKNHHIYLQHCLRGLYDTYHFTNLPTNVESSHPKVNEVIAILKDKTATIDEIFNILFQLKNDKTVPMNTYDFPAPFIRLIIHTLDSKTMNNVKHFSAISQTVIDRKEYFPKDTEVQKIYHPSNLTNFENNSYDYFFTASRLDGAKRIQMIVDAYKKTTTTIPLKIAGSGPLLEELKRSTKDDSRIELLGFISDDELENHYSNAYAVLFVPYDEDFGLITIEAGMCNKPVLTFSDSGGVVEFVEHNVTGLVCEPNIEKLAKNIDYLASDRQLCKAMGKEIRKRVENITWKNTIETLLNAQTKTKTKITVLTTYGIYPPRGGGQNRIFYLYKEIAKVFTVEIVCLVSENEPYKKIQIAPNLYEIRVPKSYAHAKEEHAMQEKAGIPITDIAMLTLYKLTPKFIEAVKNSCSTSAVAITSHPYTYPLLKEHVTSIPIIYESHNVEYKLKKQMLKETPYNKELLEQLFAAEKEACNNTTSTTVCAYDDVVTMQTIYGFDTKKATVVPNGVDLNTVPYISIKQRVNLQNSYNLQNQNIVLFIGSWHQPNIDAVYEISKIAEELSQYKFIVMGSVGKYFAQNNITTPSNVGFSGITTDIEKELYLSIADIAINPMLTGSGTNLKMLDYMANGIPVISTKVGARGLNIPKGYIVECDIKEFPTYIKEYKKYTNIEKSRTYVEEHFSWEVIHKRLISILRP